MNRIKQSLLAGVMTVFCQPLLAIDHLGITTTQPTSAHFPLIVQGVPACNLVIHESEDEGIQIATRNLQRDFERVCGQQPQLLNAPSVQSCILIGTLQSPLIRALIKQGKIDEKKLKGKWEQYLLTTLEDGQLVIVGSDRRGTIYGIYELSEQLGVSPWYDWADVPVISRTDLGLLKGEYTNGEPAVKYRGIFLNDEAPCLTTWVKNTYGTDYGDHRFYARVFELLLRLRANFMWPAMWGWSFYADDPLNSATADKMGIIMGTSHHEPMARNHQEWARHRKEYGQWNYATNQKVIDQFFREGVERCKDTEDIITIGMRGDGDTAMGGKEGEDHKGLTVDEHNIALLKTIFKNQRNIIQKVTGQKASKHPQVWTIYKEVLRYYQQGLRVPDDVIMMLCDDNWGNVAYLPNAEERKHPGGWGLYYHVDYVGAPRNSKWLNMTPIQNMWEQLQLTYCYGVDKLWILNVGDLKPMEYPISLFLNMAWNPTRFTVDNLLDHPLQFCAQQFGADQAAEAMRILNLYCKYNGRVTAEMLDSKTYNVESGEWKTVSDDYLKLELDATRQYHTLPEAYKAAYEQLILFPVQAMANLYEMYYAQAMNHKRYKENNPEANYWADKVEVTFQRDSLLCRHYNKEMAGGKWDGMMIQKHIGYKSWGDNFKSDTQPQVYRLADTTALGGYTFIPQDRMVVMEAEHCYAAQEKDFAQWKVIPYQGRTLSGVALMPYTASVEGANLTYKFKLPKSVKRVKVHVVVKSTLAFSNHDGHRYQVSLDGAEAQIVNFNGDLNEKRENVYSKMYPTVARRVVEKVVEIEVPTTTDGNHLLTITPLDPGIVFQKVIVDFGGYKPSYLFGEESPSKRVK